MDPVEACRGPRGVITKYQIRFQSGSTMDTNNVDIGRCTAGRCSHTFQTPSNIPSSYDIVSVVAINVLGVGPARTCTTQSISKLKCYYVSLDEHKTFLCQELVSAHIHFLSTFYTKVCILQRDRHCVNFKSIVNTVKKLSSYRLVIGNQHIQLVLDQLAHLYSKPFGCITII